MAKLERSISDIGNFFLCNFRLYGSLDKGLSFLQAIPQLLCDNSRDIM